MVIAFNTILPIRVTAWSRRVVFYSTKSVIVRSISAQGMD